jgi:hypothetical protein
MYLQTKSNEQKNFILN